MAASTSVMTVEERFKIISLISKTNVEKVYYSVKEFLPLKGELISKDELITFLKTYCGKAYLGLSLLDSVALYIEPKDGVSEFRFIKINANTHMCLCMNRNETEKVDFNISFIANSRLITKNKGFTVEINVDDKKGRFVINETQKEIHIEKINTEDKYCFSASDTSSKKSLDKSANSEKYSSNDTFLNASVIDIKLYNGYYETPVYQSDILEIDGTETDSVLVGRGTTNKWEIEPHCKRTSNWSCNAAHRSINATTARIIDGDRSYQKFDIDHNWKTGELLIEERLYMVMVV